MSTPTEEVPLCTRCLRPVRKEDYYCPHCGQATGQYTTYLPYIDIPFQVDFISTMWKRAGGPGASVPARVGLVLLGVVLAPVLILLLPFALLARRRKRRATPSARP